MKKVFEAPEIELCEFAVADVITVSTPGEDEGGDNFGGGGFPL